MSGRGKYYLCIDLKSFYASVECVERGLDPMRTNLVVADPERGRGTVCLAVSPSMKRAGVKNRCRVFQIPKSIPYIMACPRMQLYIEYSSDIYAIYLKYIAKEDIHVYSVDEVFLDVTDYLLLYQLSAWELARRIMDDIRAAAGIPSACGIGTNLYLAKVALDISAKRSADGIAFLDEASYRKTLWRHEPITDFWRIGPGIAGRLKRIGAKTMEEVTQIEEKVLYKLLGVDAEILIEHAWGRESVTIADIKAYCPKSTSLSSGQVLMRDYAYEEGLLIVKEMVDGLCLELLEKGLATDSVTMTIRYSGEILPAATGTAALAAASSSFSQILPRVRALYARIVNRRELIRKVEITFNRLTAEGGQQYDLFTDPETLEKERRFQKAVLSIKNRFGKDAVFKGIDLLEGATARERNHQIGGHKR